MVYAVLATGPSLNSEDIEKLRGKCKVVCVSDAYRLAPWADVLVSSDAQWWKVNKEAQEFEGLKFSLAPDFCGLPKQIRKFDGGSGWNSGLLGIRVAVHLGATKVLLLGFDMKSPGNHFFGKHPAPLKSSTTAHMERFKRQFQQYKPRGVQIINCTNGSALLAYPQKSLEECLSESPILAS